MIVMGLQVLGGHMMLNHEPVRTSWTEYATSRKYHVQSNEDLNNTKRRGETADCFLPIFGVAIIIFRPATQIVFCFVLFS